MTLFSDRWLLLLSVAMGVNHTEVPNLGVVSDTFPFSFFVTLFGGCSYDGVSATTGVQTQRSLFWWLLVMLFGGSTNFQTIFSPHFFLLTLFNDCLWYDKLWGPFQRVVTLLHIV